MKGKIYDEKLLGKECPGEENIVWYEVNEKDFDIFGVIPGESGLLTCRIPFDIAEQISPGVCGQCGYGAGGRIRFLTDSSFVALRVEYGEGAIPTVCNHCFTYGFDLYASMADGRESFVGAFRPAADFDFRTAEFKVLTGGGEVRGYTLNMPHFAEVKRLYLGFEEGCSVGKGRKYRNTEPIVFYGSSITHGAAAGRPGNTYESFISQKYNLDYINLGFAGNAKGERRMAEYIADLDMCMLVCDYDHNAPDADFLQKTHFAFYEIIRRKHPDIPYIMVSKPDYFTEPEINEKRREVILKSVAAAKACGDEKVFFADGRSLFDGEFYESCTSDGCHPNDLGFFRMADKIGSLIADIMKIK